MMSDRLMPLSHSVRRTPLPGTAAPTAPLNPSLTADRQTTHPATPFVLPSNVLTLGSAVGHAHVTKDLKQTLSSIRTLRASVLP